MAGIDSSTKTESEALLVEKAALGVSGLSRHQVKGTPAAAKLGQINARLLELGALGAEPAASSYKQIEADPMQAGIDANEESLRRMFAKRKAKRGTGESQSPEPSPSEASTTPTPPDSEA